MCLGVANISYTTKHYIIVLNIASWNVEYRTVPTINMNLCRGLRSFVRGLVNVHLKLQLELMLDHVFSMMSSVCYMHNTMETIKSISPTKH